MKRLPKGPNGGIELLLIQSVDNLGKQGDVVEVKPGYAHNYLIPQGLATVATDHHKRMVEKHKALLAAIYEQKNAECKALYEQLQNVSVSIPANANDEGRLYGSVGAPEILAALKEQNITLAEDQVRLPSTLQELGLYKVKIHLSAEYETELSVWVVPTVTVK
ncbi:MAG: 50S ribosomal protein L9 [Thermoguttaceae bacterium]|nr:50S ribosomal protein L9 [Thermoguttaceae bacterium]MBP3693016.1 50S ribosomal protein L9 [Thermoguttaceae bacterium]